MTPPLAEQTVWVTGAAQGLGAAIARAFAAAGARLVLFDYDAAGLAACVAACGGAAKGVTADLSDRAATEEAIAEAFAFAPTVDTVIHNAAILTPLAFEEVDFDHFARTVNVGLQAGFLLASAAWPKMRAAGGGALVFVSSRSGIEGFGDEAAYCAAKHGLEGFSKSLAQAGEGSGIISVTVTPGMYMRTPMSERNYPPDLKSKWVEPDILAPAFTRIAGERPAAWSGQRLSAWDLVNQQGSPQ